MDAHQKGVFVEKMLIKKKKCLPQGYWAVWVGYFLTVSLQKLLILIFNFSSINLGQIKCRVDHGTIQLVWTFWGLGILNPSA